MYVSHYLMMLSNHFLLLNDSFLFDCWTISFIRKSMKYFVTIRDIIQIHTTYLCAVYASLIINILCEKPPKSFFRNIELQKAEDTHTLHAHSLTLWKWTFSLRLVLSQGVYVSIFPVNSVSYQMLFCVNLVSPIHIQLPFFESPLTLWLARIQDLKCCFLV